MASSGSSTSSSNLLGLFEQQTDVGTVSRPGSCTYDDELLDEDCACQPSFSDEE